MHKCVKQNIIVHFIIQKLKNKHTVLKNIQTEKAEEPVILTEREETKTRYFPPLRSKIVIKLFCGLSTGWTFIDAICRRVIDRPHCKSALIEKTTFDDLPGAPSRHISPFV